MAFKSAKGPSLLSSDNKSQDEPYDFPLASICGFSWLQNLFYSPRRSLSSPALQNVMRWVFVLACVSFTCINIFVSSYFDVVQFLHSSRPAPLQGSSILSVLQVREPVPSTSLLRDQAQATNVPFNLAEGSSHKDRSQCSSARVLMRHSFGQSYNHPFVGFYEPPSCQFNQVVFSFTVQSRGRQFDRLGLMFLDDIEIFRTSTAEPTSSGIKWTYYKDVSNFLPLLLSRRKIIFDLGNLINDIYTGPFNTTLTATFSYSGTSTLDQAEEIVPISAMRASTNSSSAFSLPSERALVTVPFPRNARRAVVSLSASGQADEEFWFGNVYQSDRHAFPKISPMLGFSPFREMQLYIDGELAGVAWPFPMIFTGGVVPGLWRPIVGIDAFDIREHEIDISPWLPKLCDGSKHTFEIRVVGIEDDGQGRGKLSKSVGNYWVVTGKIFLWLNEPGSITAGGLFYHQVDAPSVAMSSTTQQNSSHENYTLAYHTSVTRYIKVSSIVFTKSSYVLHSWYQLLDFSSHVNFTNTGGDQVIDQNTKGVDKSSSGYLKSYSYPLWVNTSFNLDPESGNFTIDAPIRRGLHIETHGPAVFPKGVEYRDDAAHFNGTMLDTTQNGSAHYLGIAATHQALGCGSTHQEFAFKAKPNEESDTDAMYQAQQPWHALYSRSITAVNGTIVHDQEHLDGKQEVASDGFQQVGDEDGSGLEKTFVDLRFFQRHGRHNV